ncbi:hypothetical protein F5Y17DRAFT_78839 [Xylariaceae sp. FL0594]|nr:hypothetical protein F5Y17DRAFT_78839 [Xylariaceae sp. FL0594]
MSSSTVRGVTPDRAARSAQLAGAAVANNTQLLAGSGDRETETTTAAAAAAGYANQATRTAGVASADARQAASQGHSAAAAPRASPSQPSAATLTCRRCGKMYARQAALTCHMQDTHVGRMCYWPGCRGGILTSEAQLLEHFLNHQRQAIAAGTVAPVECPWPGCGKTHTRRDTVQRCIKAHNRAAPRGV